MKKINKSIRVLLTNALRALVNELFYESFDITYMRNLKNCQTSQLIFLFL